MNEPEDTEGSIPLDAETAGEVSRLAREFGVESDSEMLKWLINYHGRPYLDDLLKMRTRLVEFLGDWNTSFGKLDGRAEIRLRVTLGEPEYRSFAMGFRRVQRWCVESEVRAVPAFPEPRERSGEILKPGATGHGELEFSTYTKLRDRERSDCLDWLEVGLGYELTWLTSSESVNYVRLVFERLSGNQLDEILSSIGREFDLVRPVDEVASLPVGSFGTGYVKPKRNTTPETRAKVEPPDPDFGP